MLEPRDILRAGDLCLWCRHPLAWVPEHGYPDWPCGIVSVFCVGPQACGHTLRFWIAFPNTDEPKTKSARH